VFGILGFEGVGLLVIDHQSAKGLKKDILFVTKNIPKLFVFYGLKTNGLCQ
jgi:hypothetical protein